MIKKAHIIEDFGDGAENVLACSYEVDSNGEYVGIKEVLYTTIEDDEMLKRAKEVFEELTVMYGE